MDTAGVFCTNSALLLLTSVAINTQPIGTFHYKDNSVPTFGRFDEILTFSVNDSNQETAIASQQSLALKNTIIILIDSYKNRTEEKEQEKSNLDPYALSWYISSFGALVVFFLAVSLTECLCAKGVTTPAQTPASLGDVVSTVCVEDMPPPPYHLFGPPDYDTLFYGVKEEKKKCELFTVEVHHANIQRGN